MVQETKRSVRMAGGPDASGGPKPLLSDAWRHWGLHVAALGLGLVLALLHFTHLVPDGPLAVVLALMFIALVIGLTTLQAVGRLVPLTGSGLPRRHLQASWILGGLLALLVLLPVLLQIVPGTEVFRGELDGTGASVEVPRQGDQSSYRVLAEGKLPSVGQEARYRLQVEAKDQATVVSGLLSRTQHFARARRGGAIPAGESIHHANLHNVSVGGEGPFRVSLAAVDPPTNLDLHLTVYSTVLASSSLPLILSILLLLVALVLDGLAMRLGHKTLFGFAAAMVVVLHAFGLDNVTQFDSLGPLFGDLLIATVLAAVGGVLAVALARRLFVRNPA